MYEMFMLEVLQSVRSNAIREADFEIMKRESSLSLPASKCSAFGISVTPRFSEADKQFIRQSYANAAQDRLLAFLVNAAKK